MGAPDLYDVSVRLMRGDAPVDESTFRVGLRTISLDRSADPEEGGRLFRFLLNDVPMFARGSNWVPPSMLRGSVDAGAVTDLVTLARDGGQNMLRIWGGGAYEQDAFYDTCDELGILVWQDFMFACFDYPSADPALQQEVALEAAHQVRRLRNHASLALWCGNNEVETLHLALRQTLEPGDWGWHLFHALLPDVVRSESPGALYWPGSPWADSDPEGVNGPLDGDRHFWDVWHGSTDDPSKPAAEGFHWNRYLEDKGKFSSEFGIQSASHLDTLERWLTEPIDIASATFLRRTKDGQKRKSLRLAKYEIGLVDTPEQYVDYSMACQAEGLKFGIEHYRRRQPHCSGTLVWQFNDCWPGMSWSVVDFDHRPKAAYYYLQRLYRPVIATFSRRPDGVELWVSNSSTQDVSLDLAVDLGKLDGTTRRESVSYVSRAYSSEPVWSGPTAAGDEAAFVTELTGALPANRVFLGQLKDLPLSSARLQAEVVKQSPSSACVRLTSTGFSYFSRLASNRPGVRFSTNYVDLRDGEHVDIEVTGIPEGTRATDALTVVSWGQAAQPVGAG
jgi:beta-mannosidase